MWVGMDVRTRGGRNDGSEHPAVGFLESWEGAVTLRLRLGGPQGRAKDWTLTESLPFLS